MGRQICVGAILFRDGQILLGRRARTRSFYPDVWDVIGGHCEPEEAVEQALARELSEEIGVTPTISLLLTILDVPDPTGGTFALHLYVVTAWHGLVRNRLPSEHSDVGWFSVEQACQLDLALPCYPNIFHRSLALATAQMQLQGK